MSISFLRYLLGLGLCFVTLPSAMAADVDEWFEREVRPLLAERCLSCHSSTLEAPKANLKLDRRDLVIAGGDSGAAIEPGKPADSLLIMAVRGDGLNRMPPDKPLSKPEIATLERWIQLGAPWPERVTASVAAGPDWLKQRAQSHWAWQPMRDSLPPQVADQQWNRRASDAYVRSKLESLQIEPAGDAPPIQLVRRLAFDLTGLPPAADLVEQFARIQRTDSPQFEAAWDAALERLLSSPEFGVTWGRHWFDLVRYCETLGHEFDYPIRHAWRYRDAVIDAFNEDLSYATFVTEHLAGDQVPAPRRHPRTQFNQSLAMTGWWWMGEGLHAPVDIWNDEATRIDNQIEVYSKTFLGLTVACARCHDHKFDPLSAADYTSLVGIMQSSRRTYAGDDPQGKLKAHNQKILQALGESVAAAARNQQGLQVSEQAAVDWLSRFIERLRAKPDEMTKALVPGSPLFALRLLAESNSEEEFQKKRQATVEALKHKQAAYAQWLTESVQLAEFSQGLPKGWYVEAADPQLGIACSQPPAILPMDPVAALPSPSGRFVSHVLGKQQQLALRSPTFDVTHPIVALRMRGKSAQSTVVVDNYFMIEFHGLLFGDLRKPIDQPHDWGWVTHGGDLTKYVGHPAYISIEDDENAWFELGEVRLCRTPPPEMVYQASIAWLESSTSMDALKGHIARELLNWRDTGDAGRELLRAAIAESQRFELALPPQLAPQVDRAQLEAMAAATPAPTRMLGIHDGTPRDAVQFVRGNPHRRGDPVPRGDLQALGGAVIESATSSGRRELAASLTSGQHPLAARVMVNRVWLQLFGQGLVDSPDNFGLLGGAPSHLELLDYLSLRFIEHDWSIKWLVRELCGSRAYRLGSLPTAQHRELDPNARYLSHRIVRRLSAEKLRDTLLAISGSLDHAQGGESVKVHLTEQMSGRGRPGESGPLDGAGRRAVYVEVRRNFLDPFLVAFDQPPPATTVGKRNASNVPAQALSLLNAPLVHEMARRWSQRVAAVSSDPDLQIQTMFKAAFARQPQSDELVACRQLLGDGSPDKLTELAHVLMCTKEFQYIP